MTQPVENIGRVTVEKLDTQQIDDEKTFHLRILANIFHRTVWLDRPSLTMRYNPDSDSLFVAVHTANPYVQLVHEKSSEVFVSFDHDQETAWPTSLLVAKASKVIPREVSHPSVVSQLLGDEFFIMAETAMRVPDQDITHFLTVEYADTLRDTWDTIVPVLMTSD